MPEYVESQVAELRGSERSTAVALLLGVSGDQEAIIEQVERTSATVDTTVGRTTLRVAVPESAIDTLCSITGISSIGFEAADVQELS